MSAKSGNAALRAVVADYYQQCKIEWRMSLPLLFLPGLGTILVFYAPPLVIAKILQRLSHQSLTAHILLPYIVLAGAIWLMGEVLWRISFHLHNRVEVRSIGRLYTNGLQAMLKKDLAFFHNNFAGSLTKRTSDYALRFEMVYDTVDFQVIPQILPLVFVCIILWRFSPWLTLALIGLIAVTALAIVPLIGRRQKLVDVREAARNVVAGHIADVYSNIDAVRTFGREAHEEAIHEKQVKDMLGKTIKSWDYQNQRIFAVTSPLYVITNIVGLIIALSVGGSDATKIGEIYVSFSYFATYTRVLFEFNQVYRQIESSLTEAAQFNALLLNKPTIVDPINPKPLSIKTAEVILEDVVFRYDNTKPEKLFDGLNITIKSGEKVGLVGRSGGGKTTITKLLLRLMDIDSGQILIDGQNISQLTQSDLRSVIGYVPQDPVMFHRSLVDNIRYGKLDASDAEVALAAQRAHAADFIADLPEGYQTLVGERGIKLSGGQRQRIAIARAMLKDAPILVLDEATSALDSESEQTIQTAFWQLMEGKTAVVIAHRLSTIQKMDRIIVLDKGKVIEEGSHNQLLKRKGLYADLWHRQSGGFIDES